MPIVGVSHFGLCISDLDRSLQFYCDILGFRLLGRVDADQDREAVEVVGRLLEIDDLDMTLAFIERDGVRIEFLRFFPPASGGGKPPMNRIGFTH
ncbi:hypothetical protein LMG28688_02827 [Paraburkholderia caffeinitolerans]|uniref:VOC domain-containing protein n=1 Tax=Paraburkholderia caffeinitolerans TaxID=1723730 RepID=A0A6J5G1H6_9BURK|nr:MULTISPECIES: VOC family protein [Paraburkholderia]CAB3789318.1 hypothetical protein LMG28688_02827 [Paraburkholderia caffeinitolerans]